MRRERLEAVAHGQRVRRLPQQYHLKEEDWACARLSTPAETLYLPAGRIETHGEPLFHAIVDGDHEGIVAKRMDAPYHAGPHNAWLKIKNKKYLRRGAVEWRG